MNPNTFGVDMAFPPPQPPGHPPQPPSYPPPPHRPPSIRKRWPALVTAGAIGALIASTAAVVITVQTRGTSEPSQALAPVTVTVAAPTIASPAPLPADQADRQTCRQGWIPAGNLASEAVRALQVLPPGVKAGDPAIEANAEWSSAVRTAADSYRRAGDALEGAIAPGTTPVLAEAAHTAVKALHLLGAALSTGDPVNGNAGEIVDSAGGHVGLLCTRLAP